MKQVVWAHVLHNDRWEKSTQSIPSQQNSENYSGYSTSDGKLDCATRNATSKNMIVKSGQSPAKDETRNRSGQISC